MVEISATTQVRQIHSWYGVSPSRIEAVSRAYELFDKSYREAVWSRVWSWILRRKSTLLSLHPASRMERQGPSSFQRVPLAKIKGSYGGRTHDFDAQFRPRHKHTKERWINVAIAFCMHKSLPPVDLVKVEEAYFVLDGHHRLSVAASIGLDEIEAKVTEWSLVTPA